ncbi:MAG: helix-turn-helix transcriptional regulator [Nocardia sp.]|nr:helix-turn-helix transcriptional regulator [Nocardia sp.]
MSIATPSPVGRELRQWRLRRRLTQLALSEQAGISTRHLSFIETGRTRPSPDVIVKLAEQLEVSLDEQNNLLLAGGYAPRHPRRAPDDRDLAPVMDGLRTLLDAHEPFPALLMDDHWDVIDANSATDVLLHGCAPALLEPPVNVLRLTFHPAGLAPRIINLDQWAARLIHQLAQRLRSSTDPRLAELFDEITDYVPAGTPAPADGPVLTLNMRHGDSVLRLVSVAARIENAQDITLDALHLETFLPADAATRALLTR